MGSTIYGRNPVTEALRAGRKLDRILIQDGATGAVGKIKVLAKEAGIPLDYADKKRLDALAGTGAHQGVVAFVPAYDYGEMEDIFAKAKEMGEDPFVVILDGVEDPHNLGAIMRTAECAGASGVIIPKRGAVGITDVVAKTSAGAVEYLPCVRVTNLVRTMEELKDAGFWIAACDMDGETYSKANLTGKLAVVIGSEGKGISRLVKEKCDFVVSMPMKGKINSLNASNAAAVIMYEVRRQREALTNG